MENIEKRYITTELRADINSRTIRGTAIVFNSESDNLGGFVEIIQPSAVTQDLINRSDIKLLYNHNEEHGVLARSKYGKGSLKVNITSTGVDFEFRAKETAFDEQVFQSVLRGDLDACSFAFTLGENMDAWEKKSMNLYKRTITAFNELFDFSIVVTPAYAATTVSARSAEKVKELQSKELLELDIEADKQAEQKKEQELKKYNQKLKDKYLK